VLQLSSNLNKTKKYSILFHSNQSCDRIHNERDFILTKKLENNKVYTTTKSGEKTLNLTKKFSHSATSIAISKKVVN
jgi:hypothetical protein